MVPESAVWRPGHSRIPPDRTQALVTVPEAQRSTSVIIIIIHVVVELLVAELLAAFIASPVVYPMIASSLCLQNLATLPADMHRGVG